jgi:hypothetical protein
MHSWGSSDDPWALHIRGLWESRELWPKAPPSSVFLLEATDVVGRAMWGHDWRRPSFDDIPWYEDRLAAASRFDTTITRIATAFAEGEIAVIFDTVDADGVPSRGRVPSHYWTWFEKESWRSQFINGRHEVIFIDGREEILVAGDDDAPRWLFVRRTDLERFIKSTEALKESAASAMASNKQETPRPLPPFVTKMLQPPSELVQQSRPGRKPTHDWSEAKLYFEELWNKRGDPNDDQNKQDDWKSDSDVARHVLDHLVQHAPPDAEPPDLSTVRRRLRPLLLDKRRLGRN